MTFNAPHPLVPTAPGLLRAYFWSGETLRSRTVAQAALTGQVQLPPLPARLIADWERDVAQQLALEPGDVEPLSLARARTRWPQYSACVQAMAHWAHGHGLAEVLTQSDVALMVCRGACYHHDSAQYGHAAFCNLFVGDDKGLDLHFSATGERMPLTRGLAVIFDTAQPHAVIARGASHFDAADYPPERDCTQPFLSWELPIEHARVAAALQIELNVALDQALAPDAPQLQRDGTPVTVQADSGDWCQGE